jgi:hypothetical protein
MRTNKMKFICAALALFIIACDDPAESLIENGYLAFRATNAIMYPKFDNLNRANQALGDIFKSKKTEYATSFKDNCNEAEIKQIDQLFSCYIDAQNPVDIQTCDNSHQLSDGKCAKALGKIKNEVDTKIQKKVNQYP